MKVLIACEYSGKVRNAFASLGHEAMSCDLLPTESDGWHYQGDVRDVLDYGWDLMIAHPPCTHLAVSGNRWMKEKKRQGLQQSGVSFVRYLAKQDIPKIAIENPVGVLSTLWRKPDQIIQPWQFGHGETKATCLWLKNLKPLIPTEIVDGREPRIHNLPPSPNRWKIRSETYDGIAKAMANQWGTNV